MNFKLSIARKNQLKTKRLNNISSFIPLTKNLKNKLGLFLSAFLFSLSTFAVDNICFNDEHAFGSHAPAGWMADEKSGKKMGLCVLYVIKGGLSNSPAIMYPWLGKLDKTQTLEQVIQEDILKFTQEAPSIKVTEQPSVKNKHGVEFAIRYLQNGLPPNEYEAVAYNVKNKSALTVVIVARTKVQFEAQIKKFYELLETVTPISQADLKKHKNAIKK